MSLLSIAAFVLWGAIALTAALVCLVGFIAWLASGGLPRDGGIGHD